MTFRRFSYVVLAAAVILSGVALAMTGALLGTASSTMYYQCVNARGQVETSRAGTVKPTCGNGSDQIETWSASPLASTPTTRPVVATTTVGPFTSTTVAATSTTVGATSTTVATSGVWSPSPSHSISWNWIIGRTPSAAVLADPPAVLDFDAFDATASEVAALNAKGTVTVAYLDLGTAEPGRPDLNLIPAADIGNSVQGFASEHWLNVADLNGLKPWIDERLAMAESKGFQATEIDDVDGYQNGSGFPLTAANQLAYNEYVYTTAHADGLSVGLKNDLSQLPALLPYVNWVLDEQGFQYDETNLLAPAVAANKAVFEAEYQGSPSSFCPQAVAQHLNSALFSVNLDGSIFQPCPSW